MSKKKSWRSHTSRAERKVRRCPKESQNERRSCRAMLMIIKTLDFILHETGRYCTALSKEVTQSNPGFGRKTRATKMEHRFSRDFE